jgi:hypothetical protein
MYGEKYEFDWQVNQRNCQCWFHRYHAAHICECGKLYDHSQGSCDEHRQHKCVSFDTKYYKHGDKAKDVFDRLMVMGIMPYGTDSFRAVYDYAANNW